jgi:hypothetical protein
MTENDSFDKSLAFQLHSQTMLETEKMLRTLAIRLNSDTRIYRIPRESTTYVLTRTDAYQGPIFQGYIYFDLIKFFGMAVGYDIESNILVYWELKEHLVDHDLEKDLRHKETIDLLRDLGEGFNSETRYIPVPRGRWQGKYLKREDEGHINDYVAKSPPIDTPPSDNIKKVSIELNNFFGTVIGYDKKDNILLCWQQ